MAATGPGKWMLVGGVALAVGLVGWIGGIALRMAVPQPPPTGGIGSLPLMRRGKPLFRDWPAERRTPLSLVLILKPSCPFCVQSAAFHRALLMKARQRNFQRILVFPDANGGSRSYLARHSLSCDAVKTYRDLLRRPAGVPAVALLDAAGTILAVWYGALSPGEEQEVLAAVQSGSPQPRTRRLPSGEPVWLSAQVQALSRKDPSIRVLSVEERPAFAADPWPGAWNLPVAELDMRLGYEASPAARLVLDCSPLDDRTCEMTLEKLRRRGFRVVAADLSL